MHRQLPRNPNCDRFPHPDYRSLGWQLMPNHPELVKCKELGHKRKEFDNSLFLNRGTDVIYYCDQCKFQYHIDMSD